MATWQPANRGALLSVKHVEHVGVSDFDLRTATYTLVRDTEWSYEREMLIRQHRRINPMTSFSEAGPLVREYAAGSDPKSSGKVRRIAQTHHCGCKGAMCFFAGQSDTCAG
jgi:hypothetical protein